MRLRAIWGWALLLACVCCVGGRLGSAFPSPKTWWTKQITRQVYAAGRLTDRQIKYAADAGFRTLVSLYQFEGNISVGGEQLLSTAASRDVAVRLSGITFETMTGLTSLVDVIQKFAEIRSHSPTPILVYCRTGRLASFVSLTSMMTAGLLSSDDVMIRGASLGYNYGIMQHFMAALATLSARPITMASVPLVSLPQWQWLWAMKPVFRNWYVMGQVQRSDAIRLRQTGIGTVINCRAGVKTSALEIPSQEEVNLLNIADFTGTYYAGGRQTRRRLRMTRIDPDKPNEFISVNSRRNYEGRNGAEYGDEVGYNETLERVHMRRAGIQYHHTPVSYSTSSNMHVYSRADVSSYLSTWVNAGAGRNVVVHCDTGYRALQVALIGAGRQYGLPSSWAVQRARQLGYHFDDENGQPVVKLLRAVLD